MLTEGEISNKGLMEYVRNSNPPAFLLKTYMLVEDPATDDIVSWNADGTAFVVLQPAEFARDLLPKLFKHSNFSSFVRQLNTYGFRKVATTRWEFCNDRFRKGEKELLCEIRRRKALAIKQHRPTAPIKASAQDSDHEDHQRSSSTSSFLCDYTILMDENKRLRKENGVLSSELTSMQRKCRELLDLVAKYSDAKEEEKDERPMVFGVRLEVQQEREMKRRRGELNESTRTLLSQSCK